MGGNHDSSSDSRERGEEFLLLLNDHESGIQAFLFSLVPHWADAQDIAQELRLRLWQQFDQYDRSKDFGAWARAIGIYLVLAHRERLSRHKFVLLDETAMKAIASEFESPSAVQRTERQHALERCIKELAVAPRQILLRYYLQQETMQQIAEKIGSTYAAVQRRLHRIRMALEKCVRRRLNQEAV